MINFSINKLVFYCFSSILLLSYIWGVVSYQHFLPSGSDFYLSTISSCILALSLCIFFVLRKIEHVSFFSILIFVFFALVLLQPLLNNIVYVDSLVISSVPLLLCGILSLLIVNLNSDEKTKLIEYFGFAILFSGVFTVFTQFVQVLNIEFFFGKLVFYTGTDRPVGNIGQVNQASFVSAMSIAAVIFIFLRSDKSKYRNIILASLTIFWLSMGLGFSASRGGILFGTVTLLSTGFFYKNEVKKRVLFSTIFIPVFVCGYIAGTELLHVYMNDNLSAVNRLVNGNNFSLRFALLQEAWLAFSQNPITGTGWGQLISFGLENAQQVKWFTVAHHSHNIVAQIAAEMGLLGLLPLLSMGV